MKNIYKSTLYLFISTWKMCLELTKSTLESATPESLKEKFRTLYNKIQNLYVTNLELGIHHIHQNNYHDAMFRFWITDKFKPNQTEVHYNIGRCYLLRDKNTKALEQFKKALQLDKHNEEALYQLHKLTENVNKIKSIPIKLIEEQFNNAAPFFSEMIIAKNYLGAELIASALLKHFQRYELYSLDILDLGCGSGICSHFLKMSKIGHTFTGVDISKNILSISKACKVKKEPLFNRLVHGNFLQFLDHETTTGNPKYDAILMSDITQYRKNIHNSLEKAAKLLKKDGIITLLVKKSKTWDVEFSSHGDCFLFSEQYIKEEIEYANLKIEHMFHCNMYGANVSGIFFSLTHKKN